MTSLLEGQWFWWKRTFFVDKSKLRARYVIGWLKKSPSAVRQLGRAPELETAAHCLQSSTHRQSSSEERCPSLPQKLRFNMTFHEESFLHALFPPPTRPCLHYSMAVAMTVTRHTVRPQASSRAIFVRSTQSTTVKPDSSPFFCCLQGTQLLLFNLSWNQGDWKEKETCQLVDANECCSWRSKSYVFIFGAFVRAATSTKRIKLESPRIEMQPSDCKGMKVGVPLWHGLMRFLCMCEGREQDLWLGFRICACSTASNWLKITRSSTWGKATQKKLIFSVSPSEHLSPLRFRFPRAVQCLKFLSALVVGTVVAASSKPSRPRFAPQRGIACDCRFLPTSRTCWAILRLSINRTPSPTSVRHVKNASPIRRTCLNTIAFTLESSRFNARNANDGSYSKSIYSNTWGTTILFQFQSFADVSFASFFETIIVRFPKLWREKPRTLEFGR